MGGKKSKKSRQDLIKSTMDGLSNDDPTGLIGPLIPDGESTKSSVDRALVSPNGDSLFREDQTRPHGLPNESSIFDVEASSAQQEKIEEMEGLVSEKGSPAPVFEQLPSDEVTRVLASPLTHKKPVDDRTSVQSSAAATALINQHHEATGNNIRMAQSAQDEASEKTVFVTPDIGHSDAVEEKISFGAARPSTRTPSSQVAAWGDAQTSQAENLRIAQERMVSLEQELEKLRAENEMLSSANTSAKEQLDEVLQKNAKLEQDLANNSAQFEAELEIHRDGASSKDAEIKKLRRRVDELEGRLHQDLRKIRVRERELENRLELTKMEKESLLRSKDDAMLDLKRKMDNLNYELQGYRQRVTDLNQRIEGNTEQFARTVRALRLALTNLEVSDSSGSMTITPLKKAE
jgi:predicted  nucleic acid-binding Zn-ribbon protein